MGLRRFLLGTLLLLGCGKSFDPFANLDATESKALDQLLADAGLDRKALQGKDPKVTISIIDGHINRLVLDDPPAAPSLETLTAFGALDSIELIHAAPSLDTLPEGCRLVELRIARNDLTDLAPLSRCAALQRLWIVEEPLPSLDSLPPLPELALLVLDQVPLRSLEGVGGRASLTTLQVSRGELTGLDGLQDLPSLERLDLSGNRITDASALDQLPALREVDVSDNALTAFPTVVLAAEVPKISGNPGAQAVQEGRFQAGLQAERERQAAERRLDLDHVVPAVAGTTHGVRTPVSWWGNEVTGQGSIERLEGTVKVVLREYDVLEVTQVKRRPADRRMTFTVGSGRVRVYFGHGPGAAPSVLVEPGTPRVVQTGLAWGDRWTGFIVHAVDDEAEDFAYVLETP